MARSDGRTDKSPNLNTDLWQKAQKNSRVHFAWVYFILELSTSSNAPASMKPNYISPATMGFCLFCLLMKFCVIKK